MEPAREIPYVLTLDRAGNTFVLAEHNTAELYGRIGYIDVGNADLLELTASQKNCLTVPTVSPTTLQLNCKIDFPITSAMLIHRHRDLSPWDQAQTAMIVHADEYLFTKLQVPRTTSAIKTFQAPHHAVHPNAPTCTQTNVKPISIACKDGTGTGTLSLQLLGITRKD
ncbi:hypothetical protein DPMN_104864 [Dreissena polymorpha]|uniref:Uncharacterized protein n=1 Tax=Dreissena polymorpha TaxID=45954 RepID=A0A9D4H8J0_DREPO|nr:hypothetical protein DPMN_104864 [Dreissena polymorpha]